MRVVAQIAASALLLCSLLAIGAAGKDAPEPAKSPVVESAGAEAQERLPLDRQVELKRVEFLDELAELQEAFAAESDPDPALALQRRITSHKLSYEISLHRLQLAHFRQIGDAKRVEALEASIEALERILPEHDAPELAEEGQ